MQNKHEKMFTVLFLSLHTFYLITAVVQKVLTVVQKSLTVYFIYKKIYCFDFQLFC